MQLRTLILSLGAAALCVLPAGAQIVEEFDDGIPAGWRHAPEVATRASIDASRGAVLALPGAGSFVELDIVDPSTVAFWRSPNGVSDDATLRFSAACGDSTFRREYRYTPGVVEGVAFIPEVIAVRRTGPCTLRWEVARHAAGTLMIDHVTLDSLRADEKARIAQEALIRGIVSTQLGATTAQAAAAQLDPLLEATRLGGPGLANLSSRVYAVSAINATGAALSRGAELGNPLNYTYFAEIAKRIESFSPAPIRTHLRTVADQLRTVFNPPQPPQGRGLIGTLASVAIGTALSDYRMALQSAIAVASGSKETLGRVAQALGIRGKNREAAAERQLNAMYEDANTFIGRMIEQTQRTRARAARADSLAEEANALAARADSTVAEMLYLAGIERRRLPLFKEAAMKRADNRALSDEEREVLERFAAGLQQARQSALAGGISTIVVQAEQLRSALRGSDAIYASYEPLIARQKKFYDEEIAYFCTLPPLPDVMLAPAQTRQEWISNAREAVRSFQAARTAFYRAYSPQQEPPPLERCAILEPR